MLGVPDLFVTSAAAPSQQQCLFSNPLYFLALPCSTKTQNLFRMWFNSTGIRVLLTVALDNATEKHLEIFFSSPFCRNQEPPLPSCFPLSWQGFRGRIFQRCFSIICDEFYFFCLSLLEQRLYKGFSESASLQELPKGSDLTGAPLLPTYAWSANTRTSFVGISQSLPKSLPLQRQQAPSCQVYCEAQTTRLAL